MPERGPWFDSRGAGGFTRPDGYLPGFEIHSAPEAIQAHIDKARERVEAIHNELGWLEGLYLRRIAEKSVGLWPRAANSQPEPCP